MDSTQARTDHELPVFIYRRFRASLDLRGASVEGVARQAKVSSRHIWHVVTGRRRGSQALLQVIREIIGAPGWAFATGCTDILRDEPVSHGPA